MLRTCIFLAGVFCSVLSQGQKVTLVNTGVLNSTQTTSCSVFDPMIINSISEEQLSGTVTARLVKSDGGEVYNAQAKIEINKGFNSCKNIIGTISENTTSSIGVFFRQNGILPEGDYNLCFDLEVSGEKLQSCELVSVVNSQLLELIYPYNEDEVYVKRPPFSWYFLGNSSNLTYRVVLKELKLGQQKIEALEQNVSLFQIENNATTTLSYPAIARDLDSTKKYIWQVVAITGNQEIAKSEIWEFYLTDEEIKPILVSDDYLDLNKVNGQPSIYVLGVVKLKWQENFQTKSAMINIFKPNGRKLKLGEKSTLNVKLGTNYFDIDLNEDGGLKHMKKYKIQIQSKSFQDGSISINFTYLDPAIYNKK